MNEYKTNPLACKNHEHSDPNLKVLKYSQWISQYNYIHYAYFSL